MDSIDDANKRFFKTKVVTPSVIVSVECNSNPQNIAKSPPKFAKSPPIQMPTGIQGTGRTRTYSEYGQSYSDDSVDISRYVCTKS